MGIYQRLGVRPMINARGTISYLGGSLPRPEVVAAMAEASREFVNTYELQRAVGRRLAELTNNEAAFVSAGAAAGLLLAAAAVMAGTDERRRAQLPDTAGMKNEAIALAVNRNPYHHCVQPAGMVVRWAGDPEQPTVEELAASIGPRTACCLYFVNRELEGRQLALAEVVEVCHGRGVPVIVDAAAQIPPFENTWRFTRDAGADVAVFSGGKGFRGPQASGLVVGTAELIEKIMFFCPPIHSVARPAKASRETVVGLLTAVEIASRLSADDVFAEYEGRLQTIHDGLIGLDALRVRKQFGTDVGKPFHHLVVTVDRATAGQSAEDVVRALDQGDPRITVGVRPDGAIAINAETLTPGQEQTVVDRFREILDRVPATR